MWNRCVILKTMNWFFILLVSLMIFLIRYYTLLALSYHEHFFGRTFMQVVLLCTT